MSTVWPAPPLPFLTLLRRETVSRLELLPGVFRGVYDSRLPQLRRNLLPAVRLYTQASAQGLSISIPEFRSTAELIIQVMAEDTGDVELAERMDRYCEIVKARLMSDGDWLQLFERIVSITTEYESTVEGEWRVSTANLTFALQYTEVFEPLIVDWLQTVGMKVDVIDPAADPNTGQPPNIQGGYHGGYPGPDGRIEAEATFTNPTPPEGWTPPPPRRRTRGS